MFVSNADMRVDRNADKAVVGIGYADSRRRILMEGSDSSFKDTSPVNIIDMTKAAKLYGNEYSDGRGKEAQAQKQMQIDEKCIFDIDSDSTFVRFPITHHSELQTGIIEMNNQSIVRDGKGSATVMFSSGDNKYNLIIHGDNDYCAHKMATVDKIMDMHYKGIELQKAAERAKHADANFAALQAEYGHDFAKV